MDTWNFKDSAPERTTIRLFAQEMKVTRLFVEPKSPHYGIATN